MTINVGPTIKRPTHHLKLSRSGTEVGIILCNRSGEADALSIQRRPHPNSGIKTYSGIQTHADREPPFASIEQNNWQGGRGSDNFDRNSNSYYDNYAVDPSYENQIILGPLARYGTGIRNLNQHIPGDVTMVPTDFKHYMVDFTATYNAPIVRVELLLQQYLGTHIAGSAITVELRANSGSSPGSVLASVDLLWDDIEDTYGLIKWYGVSLSYELVSGTTYWIGIKQNDFAVGLYGAWGMETVGSGGSYSVSTDGSTWINRTIYKPYFRVLTAETPAKAYFFDFKGAVYAGLSYDTGSAPKIFINGDQGAATSGSTTTLVDSAKSWTTNEWANCIVVFTAGTGSKQPKNWATIQSNNGTTLTLETVSVAPGANTEYTILGSHKWTELTGHGLTSLTDILSFNQIVYLCQGDDTDLRRMRRYNNAGTWTTQWVSETNNKATFMKALPYGDEGIQVWKANRNGKIAKADAVWGGGTASVSDLDFDTDMDTGDLDAKITGLEIYGEPATLWVFKEDSVQFLNDNYVEELQFRELKSMRDYRNGQTACVSGYFLWFNILNNWQRYYRGDLDNRGPTTGIGLPSNRRGEIAHALPYAGGHFLVIDGGENNYSSILFYNNEGWHEVYRAPFTGRRIRRIHIKSLPGNHCDRMYFSEGSDLVSIPISDSNPYYADSTLEQPYEYTWDGQIELSPMYANYPGEKKYWHSFKVVANIISYWGQILRAQCRVTDQAPYTKLTEGPTQLGELNAYYWQPLSSAYNIEYGQIQYKLRINTTNRLTSPKIQAVVTDCIVQYPLKWIYSILFRASDKDHDLNGDLDDIATADAKIDQIDTWAGSPTPILMNSVINLYDSKYVKVQPGTVQPVRKVRLEGKEYMIYQAQLVEV